MATIVYRENLNRKMYFLVAKKKKGRISLVRTDEINGFSVESGFIDHPPFSNKQEAIAWIKKESRESFKKDKEFMDNYR